MTMIKLISFNHETFEIEEEVAKGSQAIKDMIEDGYADSAIPLTNVTSEILAKVIEYLKRHAAARKAEKEVLAAFDREALAAFDKEFIIEYLKKHVDSKLTEEEEALSVVGQFLALAAFDKEFLKVDPNTLFDLMVAARYLNIQSLSDLAYKTVVEMLKGKTLGEACEMFRITNDFTPEEEADFRRQFA